MEEGETKRLEPIEEQPAESICRQLWTVVEGKKTRSLAAFNVLDAKWDERRLNEGLRGCLLVHANHMRDCAKMVAEAKLKLGDRPAFVLKTDISKCYDNIIIEELFRIVERTINDAFKRSGCPQMFVYDVEWRRRHYCGSGFSPETALRSLYGKLPEDGRKGVKQTTKIQLKKFDASSLLSGIKQSFAIPLKHSARYYKQIRGIPQGSAMSCTLCYLYITELLEKSIPGGLTSPGLTVLYYVDDLLIIDQELGRVKQAARNLLAGTMGLKASAAKTFVNFRINGLGNKIRLSHRFQWTSWELDSRTLSVKPFNKIGTSRLRILGKHSPFGNVRRMARLMLRSGRLHLLPRVTTELRKNTALHSYVDSACSVLSPALYRRYFLKLIRGKPPIPSWKAKKLALAEKKLAA
ncbi:unnamed protein product, partial [Mesorhabditis spiculigera]